MKIALIQMTSKLDPEANLSSISALLKNSEKVDAVFLPECFYSLSDGKKLSPYLVSLGNSHYQAIQELCRKHEVALIGGSCATQLEHGVSNRAYCFDEHGNEFSHYDKIHLFKMNLGQKDVQGDYNEGRLYTCGKTPMVATYQDWKIGLSICFDLRFPELYRYYFSKNVDLISICAAFTVPTGKAHWESLIRARAIETQSYVVASAQWGVHNERITTYGHSMVVSPWGEILINLDEGEKIAVLEIDKEEVQKVRKRMDLSQQFYM